jgi:16S rRNA (cytosine1402-N4)-methyltransferase
MNTPHYPVMNREVVEALLPTPARLFVDGTLGLGGHAGILLRAFPAVSLVGFDLDPESLTLAQANLAEFGARVRYVNADFTSMWSRLPMPATDISGLLVDPGLSMAQLQEGERGFSHSHDGPLDMRKDRSQILTAATVLNTWSERDLGDMFFRYAEDPRSRQVAKQVIEARLFKPFQTTRDFSDLIVRCTRWRPKKGVLHPAARFFQALRIVVNRELEGLEEFILGLPGHLKRGARFVFISYHSLEDRIVKHTMAHLSRLGQIAVVKPFPRFPSAAEIAENPPSRSARMRVGEVA